MTTGPAVALGPPKVLFDRRNAFAANIPIAGYSLSHDGKDFLLVTTAPVTWG